jgi:dTDP-4-amino-4,6-dideoxygalactose transaminase
LHVGATPVLADIGSDGNIDPQSVESKITERTRAIIPVHLTGLPCEMSALWAIAKKHNLYVIEDCAHAAGAHYRFLPIGAGNPQTGEHSDAAVFSFYATKNLTTGEGGMITTHSSDVAEALRNLCLHGISKNAWNRYSDRGSWFYEVLRPGFKYNLTDLQSALGLHQMRRLEGFIRTRTEFAHLYNEIFSDVEELETPPDKSYCRHAWHLYSLRLNLDRLTINRAEFIEQLTKRGIGTSVHFIPIPLHPAYREIAERPENQCPETMKLYPRLISLPLYPAMTRSQVEFVGECVKQVALAARKRSAVFA